MTRWAKKNSWGGSEERIPVLDSGIVILGKPFYLQGLRFFTQNRTELDQRDWGPFLNLLATLTSPSCFPGGGHAC